ncbi:hypothetical protein [Roseomonas sp. CECT 9278]|uniref:hypothetical protein n=1 Tax=Roseomonas sp. CECT 9278 TaxID=2845823 RepID=UPI001E5AB666|nr:hypothetical protein [Roseomonas sp. CECT 9278]CAH0146633.1 hypothetical protein ROS9278_00612 [Roseomonas sp. CECT 9278]
MLDTHDTPVGWPAPRPVPPARAADDWLAVPEADLHEAHGEACALFATAAPEARLRHARSIVLIEQLLAARALLRAGLVAPAAARAALQADHALGYFFGLAASGGDPTAAPPNDRALAAALRHVHGLVFGMAAAHRIADAGAIEVGAAFGDGLLAAEADLHGFLAGAVLPMGLLAALPWAGCTCGGDPTARPH